MSEAATPGTGPERADVVGGPVALVALEAVAGHVGVDEARVAGRERVVVEPGARQRARPGVGDEHVGAVDELGGDLAALGRGRGSGRRCACCGCRARTAGSPRPRRRADRSAPERVAVGRLDLHDVRAPVAEDRRRRPGRPPTSRPRRPSRPPSVPAWVARYRPATIAGSPVDPTPRGQNGRRVQQPHRRARLPMTAIDGGDPIDLTDPDRFADGPPHEAYRRLRDEAPVFWHEPTATTPDGEGFWCLTRHEDVTWAAKHPELFSSAGGGDRDGGGTLIEDLPAGVRGRRAVQHAGRPAAPAHPPPRHAVGEPEAAAHHRGRARRSVRRDPRRGHRARAPATSSSTWPPSCRCRPSRRCSGVPQDDRHFLLDWADTTLDYDDHDPGETSARAQEAGAAMSAYSVRLLDEKRRCPADDIMSIVANADLPAEAGPGGPMTDLEQQMFFHLLVAAGSETTRNSIAAGVLALMDRPDEWEALRADRTLLPGAVEEMLRWASSTIYNRRTATRDGRAPRQTHPRRRQGRALVAGGELRRAGLRRSVRVRHRPEPEPPPELRGREPLLPRRQPRPPRDPPGASTGCSTGSSGSSRPGRSSGPGRTSTPASATSRSRLRPGARADGRPRRARIGTSGAGAQRHAGPRLTGRARHRRHGAGHGDGASVAEAGGERDRPRCRRPRGRSDHRADRRGPRR